MTVGEIVAQRMEAHEDGQRNRPAPCSMRYHALAYEAIHHTVRTHGASTYPSDAKFHRAARWMSGNTPLINNAMGKRTRCGCRLSTGETPCTDD